MRGYGDHEEIDERTTDKLRRFGVEIEFVGDMAAVMRELNNAGLGVRDSRHTHSGHDQMRWTVKRDGSVYNGGELVSPPLDFDDDDQRGQVTTAVKALQSAGAQPDPSAGIHIHIEAVHEDGTPMSGRELASVVRFTYKFEDAIYRIASSGWRTLRSGARTYAQPIPENIARAIMQVRTRDELDRVWNGESVRATRRNRRLGSRIRTYQERYVATNLRSVHQHNTIEFRYFNSSVNPVRIQTYIAFCMAIVQDARNGYSRSVKKCYPLGSMHSGRVSEKALFLRLQQVLRSNSKDSRVCMSEQDWKNLRKICWNGSVAQEDIFYRPARNTA